MTTLNGLVIRTQSGFYSVQVGETCYMCKLRGRMKRGPRLGDMVAIGDHVEITPLDHDTGVIELVEPRRKLLCRMSPGPMGEYQQIIIANPDLAILVFACAEPAPRFGMLDRYLVILEKQQIPPLILVNKIDLLTDKTVLNIFSMYEEIGYPVHYISAKNGTGVVEFLSWITGRVSVLTGPSGVGKSSLLNYLIPDLNISYGQVSQTTGKGKHTTVVREMYSLPGGGYLADTPGLKALALWDITSEELDGYFPELRPLVAACHFHDCAHITEPGCAVLKAVEDKLVHPSRYESYKRLRLGDEE